MRVGGINVFAVIAAALAFYVVGAIWYGLLFTQIWLSLTGYQESDFVGQEWRIAFSWVMPLVAVIAMAAAFRWGEVSGLADGLARAAVLAIGFTLTSNMYDLVYGFDSFALLALDSAHLLLACLAAGAVLALWR